MRTPTAHESLESAPPAFTPAAAGERSLPARPVKQKVHIAAPVEIDQIDESTRARLGDTLHAIFCESFAALSRKTVLDEIVFRAGGKLYLIRDDAEAIIGFATSAVHEVEVRGRVHGIFEGGIYVRPGYHVGAQWGRRSLRVALEEKLRHPSRPLALVIEALTPISYRLAARTFSRVYPTRHAATPPLAAELIQAVIAQRGLLPSGGDPAVVHYPDPASLVAADRIGSSRLRDDPDVRFYQQINPDYTQGHLVCTLVPFGWRDLARALLRPLWALMRR